MNRKINVKIKLEDSIEVLLPTNNNEDTSELDEASVMLALKHKIESYFVNKASQENYLSKIKVTVEGINLDIDQEKTSKLLEDKNKLQSSFHFENITDLFPRLLHKK